jgi:uncharacterized membrane protein
MVWMGDGAHWGWAIGGMTMMVVFWGGVLLLGWFTVTRLIRGENRPESPDEILKKPLARGEITSDDYQRLRQELRS